MLLVLRLGVDSVMRRMLLYFPSFLELDDVCFQRQSNSDEEFGDEVVEIGT